MATAYGLFASLVAAAVARSSKKPIRLDIGFGIVACALLIQHGSQILETYDVRVLQRELSSASPADREKALTTSKTQSGVLLHGARSLAQEANDKIAAIFSELDDPTLDPLGSATISDKDAIHRAHETVNEKADLARSAMQRVDVILSTELQEAQKLASGLTRTMARNFIEGVKARHYRHRSLYQRRADLWIETLNEFAAALAFLGSRAGTYRIEENKGLIFQTAEDADLYNAHLSKLSTIVARDEQLDKEFREEEETSSKSMDSVISGEP